MPPPDVMRSALGVADGGGADEPLGDDFRLAVECLKTVLDGSPEPVLAVDRERRIRYANPAVESALGWHRQQLVGAPISSFVLQPGGLERGVAQLRIGQAVRRLEIEVLHRDGSRRWMAVSATPLRLRGRASVGAVVFLRDETDAVRKRSQLTRKNAELEQTLRALSHDLRSPLVALLGFSRLLREDYAPRLDDKGRHFLERIEQAGRTMEGLIRDLLEFSRIGHDGPQAALTDPRDVLLELQAELKPRLDARRVRLTIPAEPPLVCCHRTRLYQLFSNLIGNALEHMGDPPGPRIEVEVLEEPSFHHVVVRDNGRGVDAAEQGRVFEIFQRGSKTKGSGIGLAIVRKIAEVHGGHAWVESEPGEGAAFHVTLSRPRREP